MLDALYDFLSWQEAYILFCCMVFFSVRNYFQNGLCSSYIFVNSSKNKDKKSYLFPYGNSPNVMFFLHAPPKKTKQPQQWQFCVLSKSNVFWY